MIRVLLSRLVLLLLVAGALFGLRVIYGTFVLSNARWQSEQQDSSPYAPDVGYFPDFVYRAALLAVFCLAGRVVFRLRLNPAPRGEGQPILLGLRREDQQRVKASPSPADP